MLIARQQLNPVLQGKVDLEDIVNRTLHEAQQGFDGFNGYDETGLHKWLRRILANNMIDEVRRVGRWASCENVSLERNLEQSSVGLCNLLAASQTSPSGAVSREEELFRRAAILNEALLQLPENQRFAVEAYYLRGLTQAEVADEIDTTRPAVAGLLRRGLDKLRELLDGHGDILF